MLKYFAFAILCLSINVHAQQKLTKQDLDDFKNRLIGTYDNNEQAALDKSYENLILHIREFELRGKHPDGYWLYVEESKVGREEVPFYQQVYRLYKDKGNIITKSYYLSYAPRFWGAWNDLSKLSKITKDSLLEDIGCEVIVFKDADGNFYGNTGEKKCKTDFYGATYRSEEFIIYPNLLISWIRGWDNNNQQVWGPEKAGYKFRKFINPHSSED